MVLSEREREVLTLLAHGLEYSEVAQKIGRSPETVKTHGKWIRAKLLARNTAHAVYLGLVTGEIS